MANQLQVHQGMAFGELSEQDVATIRETIAKDANDSQFRFFMATAKASGANPLTNEIYAAVRSGQLTIQYGYDFFVRKAKESDGYEGYDVQLIHENDEVVIERKTDDKGRSYQTVEKHNITFPRGKIIGCYAIAYREGLPPFMVPMEAAEVEHLRKSNIGMQKTMWTNYFGDMFKKHVLRRALKGQFGLEFDDHEPTQTDPTPEYKPKERKDITPNQEQVEQPKEEQVTQTDDQTNDLRNEINQKFSQLGIKTKKQVKEYLENYAPNINPATATAAEMSGLIELMDMHIEDEMAKAQEQASEDDEFL